MKQGKVIRQIIGKEIKNEIGKSGNESKKNIGFTSHQPITL